MKKEFQTKKESVTQKPVKNNQGIVGPYPPTLTDIPMYDPQTGEPNPNYEKLTGKKNPLAEIRKTGASKKSMLPPPYFEPRTKNRFLVKFPEEMKIKPFCVASINLPIIKNERVDFFGIHFKTNTYVSDFEIEMIDSISGGAKSNIKTINEWFFKEKQFNLDIELLDATGVIYEKFALGDCLISKIDFGELNYDDKSLLKYKLTLKTDRLDLL